MASQLTQKPIPTSSNNRSPSPILHEAEINDMPCQSNPGMKNIPIFHIRIHIDKTPIVVCDLEQTNHQVQFLTDSGAEPNLIKVHAVYGSMNTNELLRLSGITDNIVQTEYHRIAHFRQKNEVSCGHQCFSN